MNDYGYPSRSTRSGIGTKFGNTPVVSVVPKNADGSMVQARLSDGTLATMPRETLERCNNGGGIYSFSGLGFETEFDRKRKNA
jgi:hypothetical protein